MQSPGGEGNDDLWLLAMGRSQHPWRSCTRLWGVGRVGLSSVGLYDPCGGDRRFSAFLQSSSPGYEPQTGMYRRCASCGLDNMQTELCTAMWFPAPSS